MNNPVFFAFSSTYYYYRRFRISVLVEYARRSGEPQWIKPPDDWSYAKFAASAPAPAPYATVSLKFEKIPCGRGGFNLWTINLKSCPKTYPLFTLYPLKRTRLLMTNASCYSHPVHIHRHTFEVTKSATARCPRS